MELLGVRVELPANAPILLLRETSGAKRVLPIYIGGPEAAAIAYALEGVESPRPLTHDLLANVIESMGGDIDRIEINNLQDHTFFARIHIRQNGHVVKVDSRPSDAIALGVATSVPIFVAEHVLDEVC